MLELVSGILGGAGTGTGRRRRAEGDPMRPCDYLSRFVAGGNVTPELHAAQRLVERSHLVTVLADDSVAPEVRSTGAEFRRWVRAPNRTSRLPEHDPARDWECKYPWQLVDRLVDTMLVGPATRYSADVGEAITRCRPSLVVCSMFCLGGMIAAEAARVPCVVLLPNIYPLPARGLPPFGSGLRPARGLLGRKRDEVLSFIAERQWDRKGLARLNTLRHAYGLAPLAHLFDQVRRGTPATRHDLARARLSRDAASRGPLRRSCARGSRLVARIILDTAWRRQTARTRLDVLDVSGSDRSAAAGHRGVGHAAQSMPSSRRVPPSTRRR